MSAINFAGTHGADVISMSWGYDGPPHEQVDIALNNAYRANIVLVASAGNCFEDEKCTPTGISYPASHPAVIAVGASDENDRRQSPSSPDIPGMKKWDSRFGTQLSVMAPGVLCPTTRNHGTYALGRGPLGKVLDTGFIGTSAAAPHVAGLAALLLSWLRSRKAAGIPVYINDNSEVRFIIEATAEKVGGYTYQNDPLHRNGTWNEEMGYGRINVADALVYAGAYKLPDFPLLYVLILFGLISDGAGVVLPPGGPPRPVDPGWLHLTPEKRDVLLGLAIAELAEGVNDRETRRALVRAGWNAIEQTAQRMGQDL